MDQKTEFVKSLNNEHFDGKLSTKFQEELLQLPIDRPDVLAFIKRMFGYMNKSGIPHKDMSVFQGTILGTLLARILPGAWDGKIPSITIHGRHKSIDQYMKNNPWISAENKSLMDIGCGFPPYTTLESAEALPDWSITGVDPSLPVYLIYDEEGNYATFDENKSTVYFQPAVPTVENWNKLLTDANKTKNRFETLLEEMLLDTTQKWDSLPRLEKNPIKNYETDRVSFMKGEIGKIEIESKDVIRCFNVLYYFKDEFFEKSLKWFANHTNENGIVIIGGDWTSSTECYYHVFQKKEDKLVPREFAFSIDCICPFGIVTWYTIHDDDRQKVLLNQYIRTIRQDQHFMDSFYIFHDQQRVKYKICPRDEKGYYGTVDPAIDPQELWINVSDILNELNEAGLNNKAVDVLNKSGYNARVNEVGHIAISL